MRQHDDNSRQIVPHFTPTSLGYDLERKLCLVLAFFGLRMAEPKKKKAFKFMNLKALASARPLLSPSLAEREALEPVLSQNITQSQMPINNQLITIIIKSKYYRISLAISIFGCIFGCRISNTPSHEHQTKHHFCT